MNQMNEVSGVDVLAVSAREWRHIDIRGKEYRFKDVNWHGWPLTVQTRMGIPGEEWSDTPNINHRHFIRAALTRVRSAS